jgi:phage/plasmid-like protein (TIGR03299 family)
MPADIEESDDGRATFVAVERHGWHQLGTLSDKELTVKEGLELANLAGLDYHLEPIAVPVGNPPSFMVADGYRASVRRNPFDRDQWQVLGAGMSSAYTLHTPEEAFAFGEDIIQQGKPLAALGSIAGGKRAFAAFKADDIMIGGVDQVRMFLNVLTSFDASMATITRLSGTRVECSNTFYGVLGETSAPTYKVRHVGEGLASRLDDALAALKVGFKGMEEFQAEAEALLDREVSDKKFAEIVERLLPLKEDAPEATKTRVGENRDKVKALYGGPTVAKINGTAWGVLNAYTEWLDWTSGNYATDEARLVSQITPGSAMDNRRHAGALVVAKAVGLIKA